MDHVRHPPNHLIPIGDGGGAILCVSLRRGDIPVPVGGMYDPSGGGGE